MYRAYEDSISEERDNKDDIKRLIVMLNRMIGHIGTLIAHHLQKNPPAQDLLSMYLDPKWREPGEEPRTDAEIMAGLHPNKKSPD